MLYAGRKSIAALEDIQQTEFLI